ncbi:spliceosome assembly protein PRP11 NDAI_0A06740 [Naumovozyma dairenensis CBS 421]|uniref:U1-type domain-containing protein n=1 Tax=Naumovozyma dairenensis (strain ATCC 10597 / BCRC 20456 / CBS 421 / NBRC 0211 / NRRL Y-12639) TaxID=1071378 RepID=G0W4U0_NAUDC|nr:hypothetical protein NDAI_0A06740 [Naumovozyma dairenensis CBS 421]CCD22828.1 hypothetical protein NDAI_0A06740 [Naumovozyma dairenensis CBS 421]
MDYQNRAGSKKGSGGIASDAQANLQRRKQVDELLRKNEKIQYTFEEDNEATSSQQNPYIYKNHSGKLVCKLCNTMHVSWSSVERHLSGKKHGLNVLRRGAKQERVTAIGYKKDGEHLTEFQKSVELSKQSLKNNGIIPKFKSINVKDTQTGLVGVAIQVDYNTEKAVNSSENEESPTENFTFPPFIRIVSGLELSSSNEDGKKYLVIAYAPFENIAFQLPNKEIVFNDNDQNKDAVDELNKNVLIGIRI